MDDSYAPAWHALSKRYYVEARYGNGQSDCWNEGTAAAERAVALDPNYVAAAAGLIVGRVERGDLVTAYHRARDLVARRADDVDAQFSMSYVLRFAGLLDESASHCEKAFLLDPRNHRRVCRSCAVVFVLRGDYARTVNYLHLDEGSDFERALTIHMLVAQGREADAVRLASARMPKWGSYPMLLACASKRPAVRDCDARGRRSAVRRPGDELLLSRAPLVLWPDEWRARVADACDSRRLLLLSGDDDGSAHGQFAGHARVRRGRSRRPRMSRQVRCRNALNRWCVNEWNVS